MYLWTPNNNEPFERCGCENPRCACARNMRSYRPIYRKLLKQIEPKRVFEWGPGENTRLALASGARVHSVESDRRFLNEHHQDLIQIYVGKDTPQYPTLFGQRYSDIYFVDGFRRRECLAKIFWQAEQPDYVVVLHDAQRTRYWGRIEDFTYVVWPERSVVLMTKSAERFVELKELFGKSDVTTPPVGKLP